MEDFEMNSAATGHAPHTAGGKVESGKYLTFHLSREIYGIDILRVREIIGMTRINSVLDAPDYVRGVISMRGEVIPIIDLRRKFGMESIPDTDRTCVVIVTPASGQEGEAVGVVVDTVSEVIDIKAEWIQKTPHCGDHIKSGCILGVARVNDSVKLLLDLNQVLSEGERDILDELRAVSAAGMGNVAKS